MNLDEDLTIQESRWRGRLISLAVLVAVGALLAGGAYQFFFRDEAEQLRETEDYTVARATINANLIISGVAEAQLISDLSFRQSGRVDEVNVKVGDVIKRGDVLAAMEAD
ncbi:MAG: efflux RND transporter periplasmic adaptor subunit, partial [Chloroflexi bacterium]|nr:efflux RND transporter periplasmic adaptor subunit [Chloroflexota bacterium]